jgi:hypothetical protein
MALPSSLLGHPYQVIGIGPRGCVVQARLAAGWPSLKIWGRSG